MAMIKCPECGKDISSTAPICPNCGYRMLYAPPNNEQKQTNLLVFVAGAIACVVLSNFWNIMLILGGAVIEIVVGILAMIISMVTGKRAVRVLLYFVIFDLGYFCGIIISWIIKLGK